MLALAMCYKGTKGSGCAPKQDAAGVAQPDELIDFHHLKSRRGLSQLELEDEVATDLQKATGLVDGASSEAGNLNRVLQLTGGRGTDPPAAPRGMPCAALVMGGLQEGFICGIAWPAVPVAV